MEFNNRLYQLRKQKGLSQEKLAAMSGLFEISLDELVMGKETDTAKTVDSKSGLANVLNEKVLTPDNKTKATRGLKIAGIVLAVLFLIDMISMIIYFALYGIPQ